MHTLKAIGTVVLAVLMTSASWADEWDEAERRIRRLDPFTFSELPQSIVAQLQARGCTVPQSYALDRPHNVVRGSFATKYQEDWAVLCSRDGLSEIQVFWGGPARCNAVLKKSPDRGWLQGMGSQGIVYSQAIDSAGRERIQSFHEAFGGPQPPPVDHDGIEHVFVGKASIVHYCYEGRWIELTGMD
jgi:hypothetical protein